MTKEKKPTAFMKPVALSETLEAIVGKGPMARTEVTQKLWAYIKQHGLQDQKDKRMINPDAKLAKVFGSNASVTMFQMTSKVSKHIKDPELARSH